MARVNHRKRGQDVSRVTTLQFQRTVRDHCKACNDEWANAVPGRLEYAQDLPAVEARYHNNCSTNFRPGYNIHKQFKGIEDNVSSPKVGRPAKMSAEHALNKVIEYFEQNSDCQLSLYDLIEKMKQLCGNDAYSTVYLKQTLIEHFGASITITEINGIKDIVTFKSKADAILYKFCKTSGNNDTEL